MHETIVELVESEPIVIIAALASTENVTSTAIAEYYCDPGLIAVAWIVFLFMQIKPIEVGSFGESMQPVVQVQMKFREKCLFRRYLMSTRAPVS